MHHREVSFVVFPHRRVQLAHQQRLLEVLPDVKESYFLLNTLLSTTRLLRALAANSCNNLKALLLKKSSRSSNLRSTSFLCLQALVLLAKLVKTNWRSF